MTGPYKGLQVTAGTVTFEKDGLQITVLID